MIGLDTNVVVRYLTRDDEYQWEQATQLIESGEQFFITNIVLCELVWVLKGKPYNYGKDEILKTLEAMLLSSKFEFENRSAIYQVLQLTKRGKADFSDYLIGAISRQAGCSETATFDRKLKDEKGFCYLSKQE